MRMSADPCGSLCILPLSGALALHASAEPSFIRKRNERERDRVRCVNEGYARLKRHLPCSAGQKRLSKVDTLKEAITYIRHLQTLLTHNTPPPPPPPSPPPSHHHHHPHHTSEARFEPRTADYKENVCPAPAVVGGERDEGFLSPLRGLNERMPRMMGPFFLLATRTMNSRSVSRDSVCVDLCG